MSYLLSFILSFIIAFSGALAPGPLLTAVIYESAKQGFKSGPLIILGHALIEIIMVTFIVLGPIRIINNPFTIRIISFVGSFILLYFGINMLTNLSSVSLRQKTNDKKPSNLALTGIIMSVANPYWTIWWLTVGLGFILGAQKLGILGITIFFLGHISAGPGWYSAVSWAISRKRRMISVKVYKRISSLCVCALIGFGIYFGIPSLISPSKFP